MVWVFRGLHVKINNLDYQFHMRLYQYFVFFSKSSVVLLNGKEFNYLYYLKVCPGLIQVENFRDCLLIVVENQFLKGKAFLLQTRIIIRHFLKPCCH